MIKVIAFFQSVFISDDHSVFHCLCGCTFLSPCPGLCWTLETQNIGYNPELIRHPDKTLYRFLSTLDLTPSPLPSFICLEKRVCSEKTNSFRSISFECDFFTKTTEVVEGVALFGYSSRAVRSLRPECLPCHVERGFAGTMSRRLPGVHCSEEASSPGYLPTNPISTASRSI